MKTPRAKLTNRQKLEALAVRPLPPPFGDKLASVARLIGEMRDEAKKIGVNREFTPDGRFLGDVGEIIGKVHFGVNLHSVQTEGEDGVCNVSGKCVEIKLRSKSDLVWVKKLPDFLIVIYLSPLTLHWGIVCNGPGSFLLRNAAWTGERYETNLYKLLNAQNDPAIGKGISEIQVLELQRAESLPDCKQLNPAAS
jgi:hypothetical protein